MKKHIMSTMVLIALFCSMLFGIVPEMEPARVGSAKQDQTRLNKTMVQRSTVATITGVLTPDTLLTAMSIPKFAILTGCYVTVYDTVESRGDSAMVKFYIGNRQIFAKTTASFKLGKASLPLTYYFAPDTIYTPPTGGTIRYSVSQAATSGTEGITEGTFKFNFIYFYPSP